MDSRAWREGGASMTFARKMIKFAGLLLMTALLFGMCTQALAVTDPVEFTIQVTPDSLTAPGDVQVSLRVANTGDRDLTDPVTLYDPAGNVVASFGDGGSVMLPAGAFKTWEGTWNVTEDQLDQGKVAYTLKYYLEDESGELVAINSTADAPVKFTGEKADLTVKRTVSPEVVRSGKQVTVTYELYNSGNVPLSDIRVKEEISRNAEKVDALQPGEKKTVTFTSKIGNADLISKATITYKAGEDKKATTEDIGEQTIPLAMPGLSIELASPTTGVNIGEAARLQVTFVNNGNITYSNVSVKDVNKGEIITNLTIPAGATVTEEKEFILTEKTTFKVTATLPNNTGDTSSLTSDELVVGVYDPQKQLILSLNLESNPQTVEKTPADVRFTLTVTNNSNIKAEDVVITHGGTYITTIDEMDVGEIKKIVRDVTISQPGIFRFTATAKDTMNNEVSFSSNDKKIEVERLTGTAEAAPTNTPLPPKPVKPTNVPVQPVDPWLTQAKSVLPYALYGVGGLFAVLFVLFAVSTVMRAKNKNKSKAAYDHLELSERRDYTEPADADTQEIREEWGELPPVRSLQENEELFQAQPPVDMSAQMNPEGAYRISRSADEMPAEQGEKRSAVQFVQSPEEEE